MSKLTEAVQFKADEKTAERLREVAEEIGVSVSSLVREAVEMYLGRDLYWSRKA